jgi:hypothetical protein
MIDLINEIESHDLLWSVRRCNIEGERVYRAVVWTGASPCVIVSEEASSPSLALGFAFSKAKTELGIPAGAGGPRDRPDARLVPRFARASCLKRAIRHERGSRTGS